jgi:hypothetical protein
MRASCSPRSAELRPRIGASRRSSLRQRRARQPHHRERAAVVAARARAGRNASELGGWLNDFWVEFCATMQVAAAQLRIAVSPDEGQPVEVRVDPTQLHQVMWNLCENALKYGLQARRPGRPGRDPLWPPDQQRAPLPRGHRTRARHRPRGRWSASSSRSSRRGARLGPRPVPRARARRRATGATLLHESRPVAAAVFRLVFSDPGRWENESIMSQARRTRTDRRRRARPRRARQPHAEPHEPRHAQSAGTCAGARANCCSPSPSTSASRHAPARRRRPRFRRVDAGNRPDIPVSR